ncbi:hypothetical protein F443_02764 [Phytophthora nicotianae P1569]|uniref:RxLR effector protein n=2 Tax=Phytophthora nicotianae TaxID=4792 RepID=V9FUI8_PHYNI|nr:hypothetical protein F443_02764 [Phytophthora nicotianae P1569]
MPIAVHATLLVYVVVTSETVNSLSTSVGLTTPSDTSDIADVEKKNLQKLAETAKNKLTSNNQYTTNMRYIEYKVDQVESNLFESTTFRKWVYGVTLAYKNNDEAAYTAMFTTLVAHYGGEPFVRMLADAKLWIGTERRATRLENVQLESENLLKTRTLRTRADYVKKMDDDMDPYDLLLLTLKARYDDAGLAKMLVLTNNDPHASYIASQIEWSQLGRTAPHRAASHGYVPCGRIGWDGRIRRFPYSQTAGAE